MIYSRVIKDPAAGDQHSWLKPVIFYLSLESAQPGRLSCAESAVDALCIRDARAQIQVRLALQPSCP